MKLIGILVLGILIGCGAAGGYTYTLLQDAWRKAAAAETSRDALGKTVKAQEEQLKGALAAKSSLEEQLKGALAAKSSQEAEVQGSKAQLGQLQTALKDAKDQLAQAQSARQAAEEALAQVKKGMPQ